MSTKLDHVDYGTIQVFRADTAIGRVVGDGVTRWEQHVIDFLQRYYRPGTNILDVGAFIGLHSIYAARHIVSSGCKVYSIEAQPGVFKLLTANTADLPNVVPMCFAATTYTGLVHVSCPLDYESFANPGGLGVVDPWFSNREFETREVTCMRLDDVRLDTISVVKIDVEGHELVTLEGCATLLKTQRPTLIVEIQGGRDRREAQPDIDVAIETIERTYGYKYIEHCDSDYVFRPVTTPSEYPPNDSLPTPQARF
jgi:FkbM family methyltransferase